MSDVVLKAINSTTRRFKVGDVVSPSDDWAPHDYYDIKARGFIGTADRSVPPALPTQSDANGDGA